MLSGELSVRHQEKRMNRVALLSCSVLLLLCTSCGTITITSDPPGATAYTRGKLSPHVPDPDDYELTNRRGTTPCKYKAHVTDLEYARVIWLDGTRSATKWAETNLNTKNIHFHFDKELPKTAQRPVLEAAPPQVTLSLRPSDVATKRPEPAVDEIPQASPPAERKHVQAVAGARWAVVIGISAYQDSRVPSLRYATKDAQAFYDWLISPHGGKYAPSRVRLLLDQEATGKAFKDALFGWLKQVLEEDVVTIYFAGHGSPESPDSPDNLFLLPFDTQYDNIASTGFPMWDIETALKRYIKARKVVVLADACHSGGVGQSFDIARRANRGIKVNPISTGIHGLSKVGDGVCVISASDEHQYSQESNAWGGGHGVFTYFLLKGLKGDADFNKDTSVTLGELTSYLSQEVRRATKNAQSPTVAGRYDPALTIGK